MTTSNTPIYASQARPWLKFYDQKYIDQTMPACTAFELVCRQNKNRLGETALEYYGRKFTYADFIVNVKKTAAALRAAGLKKGDIATVVSVMTPEIIFAFYAADMIGATLNLVDPRYSVEGIREYIEEVDSHLLICLNVVYERCHQAAKRTHVEHVVVLSPADSLPLPLALGYKVQNLDKNKYHSNVIHWKQFLAAGKDESIAAEPYDPEHACVVVHTGGTTGSPKGVMLTDNNFNGIAMQFSACDTLFSKGQSLLNIMPPFIAYGFACGVHLPLTLGIKVVIIPNLDPNKLGSLIWKYKPEHMFGVPSHYQQLAVDPKLQNKDLSFIRNYAAGGDAIARGAEQTVNDFLAAHNVEFPIAKGYGTDRVARLLMSHDVANFMVEIGGEVYAKGNSEKRLPWRIGVSKPVDDPDNDAQELETVLNVTNQAMATSGNYRNFYYKGGRKYAHTIDPKTGRPVQHSLLSATVLAPTCAEADAYATSFMVMGLDKARQVLERKKQLKAYFIYQNAQGGLSVWKSEGLDERK